MKIAGFNFKKISGEVKGDSLEGVKINTGINVSNISSVNAPMLKSKEDLLQVEFEYSVSYDPDFAKIEFLGILAVAVESKEAKEILKQWKDKQMPEDFKIELFNVILRKSNIKAIQLEDELHLPIHINLPKVSAQQKAE